MAYARACTQRRWHRAARTYAGPCWRTHNQRAPAPIRIGGALHARAVFGIRRRPPIVELSTLPYVARVEAAEIQGGTIYRVRLGPYPNAASLASAKQALGSHGIEAMAIKAQ